MADATRILHRFSFTLLPVLIAHLLVAQSPRPTLHGQVLDPARTPIAGARITATPEGGASTISAVSGPSGDFSLELPPATYQIKVAADGFAEQKQSLAFNTSVATE